MNIGWNSLKRYSARSGLPLDELAGTLSEFLAFEFVSGGLVAPLCDNERFCGEIKKSAGIPGGLLSDKI